MKMCAAEGPQRNSLCYGCTRRRLGCRKECTRGAEEEIMNILLTGERKKRRLKEQDVNDMTADSIARRLYRERKGGKR